MLVAGIAALRGTAERPGPRFARLAKEGETPNFGRDYGLAFVAPQGLSTESEASAKDVARLIQQIREQSIHAVIVENIGDPRLMRRIADETGAVIGGTLHSDALSGPDGKYIVTAIQENELHGWRVSDCADMRMSGYPTKVKSMSWLPKGRYLATGGAESVVCWPFHGKGGPVGKAPLDLGWGFEGVVTVVAADPWHDVVAAGYKDGTAILVQIDCTHPVLVKRPGKRAVIALAWSADGQHLALGTESGFVGRIGLSYWRAPS